MSQAASEHPGGRRSPQGQVDARVLDEVPPGQDLRKRCPQTLCRDLELWEGLRNSLKC